MRKSLFFAILSLAAVAIGGTKDKSPKVTYREMALGMRDAFNCGVLVEEHLHGKLKDDTDLYNKEHASNNCSHVEEVLNTIDEQKP